MAGETPIDHDSDPRPPQKPEALRKLEARWSHDTLICVGLDSEYTKIPRGFRGLRTKYRTIVEFNQSIVDATHDLVCAYKPNLAFYEAEGVDGLEALVSTMLHIERMAPFVLSLIDGKKGDTSNTNRGYARFLFDTLGADAVTVSPYLGSSLLRDGERKLESLTPFLERRGNLVFVLCRTSNDDAGEFQDLPIPIRRLPESYKKKFGDLNDLAEKIEGTYVEEELEQAGYENGQVPLFLVNAHKLRRDWNINGNVGLVVGATYPQELGWVRYVVGDMPILIPGLGAQAGEAEATVKNGRDSRNQGMIINSSREIIFASSGEDFAEAARTATQRLHGQINQYRLGS